MPKETIYDEYYDQTQNLIEVQWAKNAPLIAIVTQDNTGKAMWQCVDGKQIDRLIKTLRRAKRQTFNKTTK